MDGDETLIANQIQGGPGSSYVAEGGDYYLKVSAMARWQTSAVTLAPSTTPEAGDAKPGADTTQADLPPCNDAAAPTDVTDLVQDSPWGQMGHIRVLDVGPITTTTSPKGIEVCHATLVTTAGTFGYDFHNVRENGKVFISGHRR